jgi:glutamyl-tRNA synthetase
MTVRTRIAPSPTGDPHVGTAYIALYNLCFARSHGGQFILRIEDTDQQRSTPQSEQAILDALRWLGLDWDEGPDVGGPHGPYRQSERRDSYGEYARQLVEQGHAFHCFCSGERLQALRAEQMREKQQPGYDGHCLHLAQEEVASRLENGEPSVVRLRVPREGVCVFQDMLRGAIDIEWSQVDMQVLLKADGMPTYHLANVVDDHQMAITHVIRGEEWINSAPKHQLLYQYFGWDMPELCHLPLLRNPDKSKLSKRKNPTSILYYQRMGYLPEAVLNYLGRMGWSMPDEREKFSYADMLQQFDIQRVALGGPIFDVEKLNWLNGLWIREELSDEQLADRLIAWAYNRDKLLSVLPQARQRMEVLSDLAPLAGFLVSGKLSLDAQDYDSVKLDPELQLTIMQFALWRLEALGDWQRDNVFAALKALADLMGLKIRSLLAPLFIAVTGSSSSISVVDAMVLLGPDMTRMRLRDGVLALGGISKKKLKKLEKDYANLGKTEESHQLPEQG